MAAKEYMRNRIALTLVYIATTVLLTGCWFSSKTRDKPVELVDFKPTMEVKTLWTASIGNSDRYLLAPAYGSGSVFTAAAGGTISRIDASSGRSIWSVDAGVPLTAGVGTDGTSVAVAGEKGVILVFGDDGKLRWKEQASSEVLSAPAVGQGLLIVRSVDNQIVAFDLKSGARRWTVRRTVPALTLRNATGILIDNATAYIGLPGGRLLALALSNGAPRWEAVVGEPRGATELERIADVSGTPVMIGHEVCAVSYQGRVACFDANNGAAQWSKELSSAVGLGADERFIFAADERGNVNAFGRESGISVWRNSQLGFRKLSTPVSFGRAVVVGDGQGYIHFLSREDGAFLARSETDGSAIVAAPLLIGDQVIIQTKDGTLVALGNQ
jgi:outer membrane protein assembly factor BamB